MTKSVIERLANLQSLDDRGYLELDGAFKGYPGVAEMYILKAESYEEADERCKLEPLVVEGFAPCKLKTLQGANKENN